MNNSNLEFRKIPSLDLLYEINENGTILRNVKSKKQIKIYLDYRYSKGRFYAFKVKIKHKIKRRLVHNIVAECWLGIKPAGLETDHIDGNYHNNHYSNLKYAPYNEVIRKRMLEKGLHLTKIKVIVDDQEYPSIISAAEYLAKLHGTKVEHIRHKMKKRRRCIYNHTVAYEDFMECRD